MDEMTKTEASGFSVSQVVQGATPLPHPESMEDLLDAAQAARIRADYGQASTPLEEFFSGNAKYLGKVEDLTEMPASDNPQLPINPKALAEKILDLISNVLSEKTKDNASSLPDEDPERQAYALQKVGALMDAGKVLATGELLHAYLQALQEFDRLHPPATSKEEVTSIADTILQARQFTRQHGGKAYIGALPLDLADLVERYAQAGRERIEAQRALARIEREVATRRATLTLDPWVQGGKNESVREANLAVMMAQDQDFQSLIQQQDDARFRVMEWEWEQATARERLALTRAWLASQNMSV